MAGRATGNELQTPHANAPGARHGETVKLSESFIGQTVEVLVEEPIVGQPRPLSRNVSQLPAVTFCAPGDIGSRATPVPGCYN